ncbi:hypothetical protein E3U43_020590 [Larimichthys crocea]|uniref:Uncharacterized protein n=1 Tax=Larimichthys crocea TaxID=215358 RepID=A0ACD3Q607_LARCR|nr:hypothetical protein E3U43_020590 [Larimichthys crocea]
MSMLEDNYKKCGYPFKLDFVSYRKQSHAHVFKRDYSLRCFRRWRKIYQLLEKLWRVFVSIQSVHNGMNWTWKKCWYSEPPRIFFIGDQFLTQGNKDVGGSCGI